MLNFRTKKSKTGKKQVYPLHKQYDYRSYDMVVLEPTAAPAQVLTQDDVWGTCDENFKRLDKGMIVAKSEERCPVWHDKLPYKSVTAICDQKDEGDCEYWLEFVHGGGSVSKRKELPGGKVALRSNYMAW